MKQVKRILALASALIALAMCAGCVPTDASGAGGTGTEATGSIFSMVVTFGLMIVLFYFLLIRPENKRKKQVNEMRSTLKVGDEVTTIGGMVGKIVSIKDDVIVIETGADRVRVELARWSVSTKGTQTTEQN